MKIRGRKTVGCLRTWPAAWLAVGIAALAPPLAAQAPPASSPTPEAAAGGGGGDLLVAPTRIVLEGRTRSAEVTLINTGREAATYRISLLHLAMTESGELREIETPESGAPFADDLVRYSPRQVTLEPNVSQVVRMQLRLPASLPAGEYRSHLLFRAVPQESAVPERSVEKSAEELPGGFSVRLTPIYGVSIPVIVRHGATSATATITECAVRRASKPEEPSVLECRLNRSGNQSVYGNVTVTYAPPAGGARVVGLLNGVAVYEPLPFRVLRVPLQPPPGVTLAGGRLSVTFSKAEQNGERLAEAALSLP